MQRLKNAMEKLERKAAPESNPPIKILVTDNPTKACIQHRIYSRQPTEQLDDFIKRLSQLAQDIAAMVVVFK